MNHPADKNELLTGRNEFVSLIKSGSESAGRWRHLCAKLQFKSNRSVPRNRPVFGEVQFGRKWDHSGNEHEYRRYFFRLRVFTNRFSLRYVNNPFAILKMGICWGTSAFMINKYLRMQPTRLMESQTHSLSYFSHTYYL